MKKIYSCFVLLLLVLNVRYAYSSDCVGADCNLTTPQKVITDNVVKHDINVIDYGVITISSCSLYNNCPFKTKKECNIWRKKPMVNEVVSPRSPTIDPISIHDFVLAASNNINITANDFVSYPLLERYKMLMRASSACCQDGLVYKMREKNSTDKDIYSFLTKDINSNISISDSCLVLDDGYLYENDSYSVLNADDVIGIRNTCLCKSRQWFAYLLKPFEDIYELLPEFKSADFSYTYTDGLLRTRTVSINKEVQNVLSQIKKCL